MEDEDLAAFRASWEDVGDGADGLRYVQALCADGQLDEALAVCAELWARGYVIGLTEAAWVARDRGDFPAAIESMQSAIEHLDGDEQLSTIGIVGCWRWHYLNDVGAEQQLRQGMYNYGSAWADLGHLLKATGRAAEGKRVLMDGAANDILECMLPLANLLSRAGDREEAAALYRRAYDLGDGHSAWNLAVDLAEDGRSTKLQIGVGRRPKWVTRSRSLISPTTNGSSGSRPPSSQEDRLVDTAPEPGHGDPHAENGGEGCTVSERAGGG